MGDVDTDEVLQAGRAPFRTDRPAATRVRQLRRMEPPQRAERRVHFRKEGTTAYWRAAFHAPALTDPDFFPMLFVDAALTGASGLNLWSGHKVPDAPAERASLSRHCRQRTRVDGRWCAAADRTSVPVLHLGDRRRRADGSRRSKTPCLSEIDRFAREGITEPELHEGASSTACAVRLRQRQCDRYRASARVLRDHRDLADVSGADSAARDCNCSTGQCGRAPVSDARQPHHRVVRAGGANLRIAVHEGRLRDDTLFVALAARNWQLPGVPMPLIPSVTR